MNTVQQYNAVLERARKRCRKLLAPLERKEIIVIAGMLNVSDQTIYNYKNGTGESLKAMLEITGAVLQFNNEKKNQVK